MPEQLALFTSEHEPTLHACDCPRHATCPRCDPDYVEQDGDWANGIVTFENCGLLKNSSHNVIPF